jgi:mannose-1-phosphate guanylyltransferase
MEQADDVIVVESSFDWSDIGSWDALRDALPTDDRGNLTAGTTVLQDTSDSIVYNTENHHLVATVHVDQLAIIHTDDATLVCPLDEAQNVKNLIRNLKENGHEQYL